MKTALRDFCIFSALIFALSHTYEIIYHSSEALKLCATAVIPSLFIFIVMSKLLTHTHFCRYRSGRTSLFISRLFNLPPSVIHISLLGLICGAPSGAIGICNLYSSGLCSKQEAERALILSNNCSAAFIMSIAASVLNSKPGAVIILISNIIATISVYLLLFRDKNGKLTELQQSNQINKNFSDMITESISSSANTVINLCGYVIFFYCFSAIISEAARIGSIKMTNNASLAYFVKSAVSSLFEMTTGVVTSASLKGNVRMLMIAGAIAFCGISVIFQVISIASKHNLSVCNFVLSKIICAFLSPLITLFLLFIIPKEVSVMNSYTLKTNGGFSVNDLISLIFVTSIFFVAVHLLAYLDKKHKN